MSSPRESFPSQAARASWMAPAITALVNLTVVGLNMDPSVGNPLRVASMLFVVFGFLAGLYALASLRTQGNWRIALSATIGLLINGFILGLLIVRLIGA